MLFEKSLNVFLCYGLCSSLLEILELNIKTEGITVQELVFRRSLVQLKPLSESGATARLGSYKLAPKLHIGRVPPQGVGSTAVAGGQPFWQKRWQICA